MSLSTLPLCYCTNVHAGVTVAEVEAGLDRYTVPVRERLGVPMAAGLWLAAPVVRELFATADGAARFAERLERRGLTCHTLNAFPYGNFHSERVKENVYVPDWSQAERLEYTWDCARVLAELLPVGREGSISTVPLGFKGFEHGAEFEGQAIAQLVELARRLDELHDETGKVIRLAIEPEPFCLLETTEETLAFFDRLRGRAEELHAAEVVARHLGVCYDVCHQAVEFEDVAASIRALASAGVRINKVHITCALELADPANNEAGREALAAFVEPRYLHQTLARSSSGEIARAVDLTESLARSPEGAFREAEAWRIHFHVPVDAEGMGPLGTTRGELKTALRAVAGLEYAPHLEVETYTWGVLPGGGKVELMEGLVGEMEGTGEVLAEVGG